MEQLFFMIIYLYFVINKNLYSTPSSVQIQDYYFNLEDSVQNEQKKGFFLRYKLRNLFEVPVFKQNVSKFMIFQFTTC